MFRCIGKFHFFWEYRLGTDFNSENPKTRNTLDITIKWKNSQIIKSQYQSLITISVLIIAKLIMEILYSRETALDPLRLLWDSPNPNIPRINSIIMITTSSMTTRTVFGSTKWMLMQEMISYPCCYQASAISGLPINLRYIQKSSCDPFPPSISQAYLLEGWASNTMWQNATVFRPVLSYLEEGGQIARSW